MKWIIAIVATLACTSALADSRWVTPPAKYVHPFAGQTVVYQHPAALEWWKCGGLVYGCAFTMPGWCVIHVWRRVYNNSLYRHERAHCNGWPYWHPPT